MICKLSSYTQRKEVSCFRALTVEFRVEEAITGFWMLVCNMPSGFKGGYYSLCVTRANMSHLVHINSFENVPCHAHAWISVSILSAVDMVPLRFMELGKCGEKASFCHRAGTLSPTGKWQRAGIYFHPPSVSSCLVLLC